MQKVNPILVIYKNKILLSCNDMPFTKELWSFIGEERTGLKTPVENVKKELRSITKLSSDIIEGAISPTPFSSDIFYVRLTDKNVNSIVRKDGLRLEFYAVNEIEKLPLTNTASALLEQFKSEITLLAQP